MPERFSKRLGRRIVVMRAAVYAALGIFDTATLAVWAQIKGASSTPPPAAPTSRSIAPGQRKVSPGMMYHHVWVVSPLMGTGRAGDPKRPVFVPAPLTPAGLAP